MREKLRSAAETLLRFAEAVERRGLRAGYEVLAEAETTSDFPILLSNEIGKVLQQAYRAVPDEWQRVTQQVDVPDFKERKAVRISEAEDLLPIAEMGEYIDSTLSESAEGYRVGKFGREFGVSWETIVNDDLRAIIRQPERFGRAAAALVNALTWSILANGHDETLVPMYDGKALFSADHGNLIDDALSETGMQAALAAIRRQTDDKGRPITFPGRFTLVVPVELQFPARKILESVASTISAGNSGIINPAQGVADLILVPWLTDANDWYLIASPADIDTIYVAFLSIVGRSPQLFIQEPGWRFVGGGVPDVRQGVGQTSDVAKYRVRHVVGVKPIDWRGMVKSQVGA